MTIHTDDPRLTALALGELSEDERQELERELVGSPECQDFVKETRAMAGLLRSELAGGSVPALSTEQQAAVVARAESPAGGKVTSLAAARRRRRLILIGTLGSAALAASVMLVVGGGLMLGKRDRPASVATGEVNGPAWLAKRHGGDEGKMGSKRSLRAKGSGLYGLRGPATEWAHAPADRAVDGEERGQEAYARIQENRFHLAQVEPLSTFSVDVDTASYANVRRFLNAHMLPPPDAVRIEELINYFHYDYPAPTGKHPFSVSLEVAAAPWNRAHRLVRIGLRGKDLDARKRPPSNLVFLIDVSGSMGPPNRLPLLRNALSMLVRNLGENDRLAIVVYASATGLVLPSTPCTEANQAKILAALERLEAGGSTDGGSGIQLAYQTAVRHFIKGGVNRVILATDGDFNVGVTDRDELVQLIQRHARSGVYLSVLGVGMGNLKDATLEQLADKGNGHYHYIDTLNEARKVLVEQATGTLVTIAKDVKIQVELNPARVAAYRLIGYENRLLAAEDFKDDKKDAGDIGAGHMVTALYEIVPAGASLEGLNVDRLRYQAPAAASKRRDELLLVKLRYKEPDGDVSQPLEQPLRDGGRSLEQASVDFKLAAAVAWFGMALRSSPHAGRFPWSAVLELATAGKGQDQRGYRQELLELVREARTLADRQ